MSSFLDSAVRDMAKTAEAEAAHDRAVLTRYCREMEYPIRSTLYRGTVGDELPGRTAAELDAADSDEAWEAVRALAPREDSPLAAARAAGLGDDDEIVFQLEPPLFVGDIAPLSRVWKRPAGPAGTDWDAVTDDLLIWSDPPASGARPT